MRTEWTAAITTTQRRAILDFLERLHNVHCAGIGQVFLIGSVARGDFTPHSDIDLLVVSESADTQFKSDVWGIGSDVSLDYDVVLNVHIYSRARWDNMRRENSMLWKTAQHEGIELTPELSHA
jgi:predicted nucleotidyltransferase